MTQTLDVGSIAPQSDLRIHGAAEPVTASTTPAPPLAAAPTGQVRSATVAGPPPSEPATRLLVEPGKGAEGFVYKLVDRSTGEILSEFPREAAKTLAQSQNYQAGAVLDESA